MTDLSDSTPAERAIEVEGLSKQFKKGPLAVDAIDLQVAAGEIYGFLGPNGAGKSTAVLMLTTLLPPSGGTARVGGYDIADQGSEVRRVIGAALQEVALDPRLTAREHMRLQTALQGIAKAERRARGDELIERVGLAEAADRQVGGYSGGMRRRLDLALALVHRPSILFLDEPTTGLDPQSRTSLWEEVERLSAEEGMTVFLTTQYLEEADQLADRVGIIDHGKIVAEGTPADLKAEIGQSTVVAVPLERDRHGQLYELLCGLGEPSDGAGDDGAVSVRLNADTGGLAGVVRELDRAGIELADLQVHSPTLDDVSLDKTGRKLEGAGDDTGEHQTTAQEA
ncbi:MAG: ATP-binding cassette domain-containing protein [Solirubrobacterales bacterium]